ncbi:MAG: GNAT family acetyltransferase [Candidatus Methanofastidiosia archaeon]|jgi:ribosomal protein S18 acetylase RimI-like enzyme
MTDNPPLIIRQYSSEDEIDVITLWHACGLVVPHNTPKTDIEKKIEFQPQWFLVGIINKKVVATCMAGYDGHRGWINYLGVLPEYQRKGYGRKIMEKAEQLLKKTGCQKINLQIRKTNLPVITFYESLGYSHDEVVSMGKRLHTL